MIIIKIIDYSTDIFILYEISVRENKKLIY